MVNSPQGAGTLGRVAILVVVPGGFALRQTLSTTCPGAAAGIVDQIGILPIA